MHRIVRIPCPVAEFAYEIAVSLSLTAVVAIIENEGYGAVCIIVNAVLRALRKRSLDSVSGVSDRNEIVTGLRCRICASGYDSYGLERSLARAEPVSD